MVIEAFLEGQGYHAEVVEDGPSALESLRRDPFDLLITDVVMPDLNGPELAVQARALNPDLKVILMSGFPGDALKDLQASMSGFEFLAKPFRMAELKAVMDRLLAD